MTPKFHAIFHPSDAQNDVSGMRRAERRATHTGAPRRWLDALFVAATGAGSVMGRASRCFRGAGKFCGPVRERLREVFIDWHDA
jgi:hypothetical protein